MLMNFNIEKDIKNRFHVYCIQNDTTMSDLIREFILSKINSYPVKTKDTWNVDLVDKNKEENIRWEDTY
jgi:hypothetical protein